MIKRIWAWLNEKLFFKPRNQQIELMQQSLDLLKNDIEHQKETRKLLKAQLLNFKQLNSNIELIRQHLEQRPVGRQAKSATTEMVARRLMGEPVKYKDIKDRDE